MKTHSDSLEGQVGTFSYYLLKVVKVDEFDSITIRENWSFELYLVGSSSYCCSMAMLKKDFKKSSLATTELKKAAD